MHREHVQRHSATPTTAATVTGRSLFVVDVHQGQRRSGRFLSPSGRRCRRRWNAVPRRSRWLSIVGSTGRIAKTRTCSLLVYGRKWGAAIVISHFSEKNKNGKTQKNLQFIHKFFIFFSVASVFLSFSDRTFLFERTESRLSLYIYIVCHIFFFPFFLVILLLGESKRVCEFSLQLRTVTSKKKKNNNIKMK